MTTGDLIRKMVMSHVTANDTAFHAAVQEYVDEERRKNHHVLAREIEKILWSKERAAPPESLNLLRKLPGGLDAPKDKDRNAPLVEVHQPRRTFESLVLRDETKDAIDRVMAENRRADLLRTHGLRPANKLLFWGPPGCGKTAAADAIARELRLPLALVRFDALVSSYLGETAANIRKVFDFGRSNPMVLFFDEFDAIGKRRTTVDEHGELKRTVNAFLQVLDGFHSETITIAATNHQDVLDPALWRRFDDIVEFPRPSIAEIRELLHARLRQIGTAADVNLAAIAQQLEGLSHSDVERIAQDATKRVVLAHKSRVDVESLGAAVAYQLAKRTQTKHSKRPSGQRKSKEGLDA